MIRPKGWMRRMLAGQERGRGRGYVSCRLETDLKMRLRLGCVILRGLRSVCSSRREEDINVDPPSPVGPLSTSPFMFSASTTTTTTTVPISVPTLSIPVSFPSLASALSPAVTDYRSPTSPTTHGPGAARLRAHAHAPVRPTFMSQTTSMSTARPGGGVPPVTPAGLMARMASLGGGRGVGPGGERGGRGLERKVRMAVVDWGVNDLPPPISEDMGMDVDGCGCYIYTHDRG